MKVQACLEVAALIAAIVVFVAWAVKENRRAAKWAESHLNQNKSE